MWHTESALHRLVTRLQTEGQAAQSIGNASKISVGGWEGPVVVVPRG